MKTSGFKFLFIILCLGQWLLIGKWIVDAEKINTLGTFVKIPCVQVDPIDPLRGTYLTIRPEPNQIFFDDRSKYKSLDEIWINYRQVKEDDYSFDFAQPTNENPKNLVYIKAKVQSVYPADSLQHSKYFATIEFPIYKYYVNEAEAPSIADKYNKALNDTTQKVYFGAFVLKGQVRVSSLWVGGQQF